MHRLVVTLLLIAGAASIETDSSRVKQLTANIIKLVMAPNEKIKLLIDSLRQSGRNETDPDEHGNTLKVFRRDRDDRMLVVQQYFRGVKVYPHAMIRDTKVEGGMVAVRDKWDPYGPTRWIRVEPTRWQTGYYFDGLQNDFPETNKRRLTMLANRMGKKLRREYEAKGVTVEHLLSEPIIDVDWEKNQGMLGVITTLSGYNLATWQRANPAIVYNELGNVYRASGGLSGGDGWTG